VFSRCAIDQSPFDGRAFLLSNIVQVSATDMQEVFPRLNQLLGKSAFVQAFRYTGRIDRLRGNITAGPTTEHIGITYEEYRIGERQSFYSGMISGNITGAFGGVLIALTCLWPMYFAAKRQRPRWWLRLLSGFLLGLPLGLVLSYLVVHIKGDEQAWVYSYQDTMVYFAIPSLHLRISPAVSFIIFSMGMGFIIFCFQLGLRRRWYIWCLVYAALAIPVSYIGQPVKFLDLFNCPLMESWLNLGEMGPWFVMHMAVFAALFLIAKVLVWVTGPRKRQRSSLSR
jgi:hypothetical protein